MKILALLVSIALFSQGVFAQKYFTKTAKVTFFSTTPMEDIKATSNQVTSIIDFATGDVVFKMLIKTFQFPKALMQEHFNEKYLESDKIPDSQFKGSIENLASIDLTKDGTYPVTVAGNLTIHGVTKPYTTKGAITVNGGQVSANAKFDVKLADHDVKIPGAVKDNIAETVEVTMEAAYAPLNK
jgi:hypothetical protein